MEAILLRLCERLSSCVSTASIVDKVFHQDIMNLILNFQSPIPGVINCSIPFLAGDGDRLLISLSPKDGLPPLPHGASVASVCRLLGADGLNALLASVLTECKILIHSADVANLAMVAEVITALIYPFQFQLPYVPVIPLSLMEVLEAPVSYFVGVPTCNMKFIDKSVLSDVVVIDLDNGFSTPDYFDGRYVFLHSDLLFYCTTSHIYIYIYIYIPGPFGVLFDSSFANNIDEGSLPLDQRIRYQHWSQAIYPKLYFDCCEMKKK